MKVRALRNLGRGLPPLKEGEVADVDDDIGAMLCEKHLAELIAIPKPVVAAVPVEPVKAEVKKAKKEPSE